MSSSVFKRFRISKAVFIWGCIAVIALSFLYAVYTRLTAAPFFTVQEIIVRQDGSVRIETEQFRYLRGRNLFTLDLAAESRRVARSYPSYEQVRLIKFYPDKLFVDFVKRQTLACIRGAKTCYLDENQVVFELPGQAATCEVPVITGLERLVSSANIGRRLTSAGTSQALFVIKQIKATSALSGYVLTRVDVTIPNNLTVFFAVPLQKPDYPGAQVRLPELILEVKIGQEDIKQKLGVLATMLAQVRDRLYTIEYIDLRFKEPVIKFKERM